jgi:hypothetical protein
MYSYSNAKEKIKHRANYLKHPSEVDQTEPMVFIVLAVLGGVTICIFLTIIIYCVVKKMCCPPAPVSVDPEEVKNKTRRDLSPNYEEEFAKKE